MLTIQINDLPNAKMHLSHIPELTVENMNVHISILTGVMWDTEQVNYGICEIGLWWDHESFVLWALMYAQMNAETNFGNEVIRGIFLDCLKTTYLPEWTYTWRHNKVYTV